MPRFLRRLAINQTSCKKATKEDYQQKEDRTQTNEGGN